MWEDRNLSNIADVNWWVYFRHSGNQAMFVATWVFTLFNASCNNVMDNRC